MCTQKYINTWSLHCIQSRNVLKTNIKMNPKPCVQGNRDEHNTPNTKAKLRQIRARRLNWTLTMRTTKNVMRLVVWCVQFECRQQTEYIYSKSISKPMLCVVVAGSLSLMMVALHDEAEGSENMVFCCCCSCVALLLSSYVSVEPYGTRRMYIIYTARNKKIITYNSGLKINFFACMKLQPNCCT